MFQCYNLQTLKNIKCKAKNTKQQGINSKLQAPNSKQYLNSNDQNTKCLEFRISDLEFVCNL